ncbi:MAG: hypothetical protein ACYTGN_05625 [Planctomycetota bacterium]
MKRILLVAVPLVAAFALWLAGRAPTEYVLSEACRRFQAERRDAYGALTLRIVPLEQRALQGDKPPELDALRKQRDKALRSPKTLHLRGWRVLLVPATARKPLPAEDDRVALRFDPSHPADPPPLRGAMEAWLRPEGVLARLFG